MDYARLGLKRIGRRKPPVEFVLSLASRLELERLERRLSSNALQPVRALFSGRSGMGKTAAVAAMAKVLGRSVFRVDCTKLLSGYIGETEKNLNRVFESAEKRGLVLFFDEADALFGKRTLVGARQERYANQEVSYLLKRIKAYPGHLFFLSHDTSKLKKAFLGILDPVVEFRAGRAKRSL